MQWQWTSKTIYLMMMSQLLSWMAEGRKIGGIENFFVCYLLISTLSDLLQLSAKLDSSPISHHWKCADQKKEQFNWRTPPFVFKCASPRSNQCKFRQCHAMGGTLRFGVTLPVFLYCGWSRRNSHKTRPLPLSKIVKNRPQPWTWPEKVMNSSISPFPQSP